LARHLTTMRATHLQLGQRSPLISQVAVTILET
jgi:hypothetical protein